MVARCNPPVDILIWKSLQTHTSHILSYILPQLEFHEIHGPFTVIGPPFTVNSRFFTLAILVISKIKLDQKDANHRWVCCGHTNLALLHPIALIFLYRFCKESFQLDHSEAERGRLTCMCRKSKLRRISACNACVMGLQGWNSQGSWVTEQTEFLTHLPWSWRYLQPPKYFNSSGIFASHKHGMFLWIYLLYKPNWIQALIGWFYQIQGASCHKSPRNWIFGAPDGQKYRSNNSASPHVMSICSSWRGGGSGSSTPSAGLCINLTVCGSSGMMKPCSILLWSHMSFH